MVFCCCSESDVADSNNKKSGKPSPVPPGVPTTHCDGYPPAIIPQKVQQIHFYLPFDDQDGEYLACTLVRAEDTARGKELQPIQPPPHGRNLHQSTTPFNASIPVIIVSHGYQSWRNQMLLAYLATRLSERVVCHSIRFDFRGNGHSSGKWRHGGYEREFEDLELVMKWVESRGGKILALIGHSKSSHNVLKMGFEQQVRENGYTIPCLVALSGRFNVPGAYDVSSHFDETQVQELNSNGRTLIGNRTSSIPLYLQQSDVDERLRLDSKGITTGIQQDDTAKPHFMIVHGSEDEIVPVTDSDRWKESIPGAEVHIVEGADHNYNGLKYLGELVEAIANFLESHHTDF